MVGGKWGRGMNVEKVSSPDPGISKLVRGKAEEGKLTTGRSSQGCCVNAPGARPGLAQHRKPLSPASLLPAHLPQPDGTRRGPSFFAFEKPWVLHSSSLTPQTWCPLLTPPLVSCSCHPHNRWLHLGSTPPRRPEQPGFKSSVPLSQGSKAVRGGDSRCRTGDA